MESIMDNLDWGLVNEIARNRSFEIKVQAPIEVSLTMGRGFKETEGCRSNFTHFYNHIPYANEIYLITYSLDPNLLTKNNLIKKIWDLNENNKSCNPIKLGIITNFGDRKSFGDFSSLGEEDIERKRKIINDSYEKSLSKEIKELIEVYEYSDWPEGIYFFPNLHSKIYFSDKMTYIGSANCNSGTWTNAEAGITTRNKETLNAVKSYYAALSREAIRINK